MVNETFPPGPGENVYEASVKRFTSFVKTDGLLDTPGDEDGGTTSQVTIKRSFCMTNKGYGVSRLIMPTTFFLW